MTNNENIYDDWRRTLDGLGLQADDRSQQKARVVAARAQVDQAISLATIADSLDQLVEVLRRPMTPDEKRRAEAVYEAQLAGFMGDKQPTPQGIQSEHDVEVGDFVSPLIKGDGPVRTEVVEVGIDQGEVWIKLAGEQPKFWAKLFAVVERTADHSAADHHEELMNRFEDEDDDPIHSPVADEPDDIDDDFGDADFAGKTDADEQHADALAALRARQGKGKKGGQKR